MPGVSVVLGLPGSGRELLAKHLASMTPNTYVVDCDQLLGKELERRTELGLTMHNMLARGQVVPLSMTLELLKKVVNLTCSDNLVLLNCPMYVDQIDYLKKEFRLDRIFYINGDEAAVASWKASFCQQQEDAAAAQKLFAEYVERLDPLVVYFSRLGKLDQLDVSETPSLDDLSKIVEQATMPHFAVVNGLTAKKSGEYANILAAEFGAGTAVTTDSLTAWTKDKLKRTLDTTDPAQMFSALHRYANSNGYPLLVLSNYPQTDKDAAAFLAYFGDPKAVVGFTLDPEAFTEQYKEENENDPADGEELEAKLEGMRKQHLKAMDEFKGRGAGNVSEFNADTKENSEVFRQQIPLACRRLLQPKAYVLVAPSGSAEFSRLIANTVCTSRKESGRQNKLTIIDANTVFQKSGHSKDLEDRLAKAQFTARAPDAVSALLWKDLFNEALQSAANPLGTFLITNFPTPCSTSMTPTTRDQFSMLESICNFMGIIHVKLSESAFQQCVARSDPSANFSAYSGFEGKVRDATFVQFGEEKIKQVTIDKVNHSDDAIRKVASELLSFQAQAEAPKK